MNKNIFIVHIPGIFCFLLLGMSGSFNLGKLGVLTFRVWQNCAQYQMTERDIRHGRLCCIWSPGLSDKRNQTCTPSCAYVVPCTTMKVIRIIADR
jgi:hypothetical protein